jgi:hypothetical protein
MSCSCLGAAAAIPAERPRTTAAKRRKTASIDRLLRNPRAVGARRLTFQECPEGASCLGALTALTSVLCGRTESTFPSPGEPLI